MPYPQSLPGLTLALLYGAAALLAFLPRLGRHRRLRLAAATLVGALSLAPVAVPVAGSLLLCPAGPLLLVCSLGGWLHELPGMLAVAPWWNLGAFVLAGLLALPAVRWLLLPLAQFQPQPDQPAGMG